MLAMSRVETEPNSLPEHHDGFAVELAGNRAGVTFEFEIARL
jgi:hypothetical protein